MNNKLFLIFTIYNKLAKKSSKLIFSSIFVATLLLPNFANADFIGEQRDFFIDPTYDYLGRSRISTTFVAQSQNSNVYIENSYLNSLDIIGQNYAKNFATQFGLDFDQKIYSIENRVFGSEPNPGIDGDPRVTIIFGPLKQNIGGYVDTGNQYRRSESETSNEREMIYLNFGSQSSMRRLSAFSAHEFQHLITFNQKEELRDVYDDLWLNELRSEVAVTVTGYNDTFEGSTLERRVEAFIDQPSESITEWKNLSADYGAAALFGEYLRERFSDSFFTDMLAVKETGIASIEKVLSKRGIKKSFADVFAEWSVANIINDVDRDSRFGYVRRDFKKIRVRPTVLSVSSDTTASAYLTVKDWQPSWYELTNFGTGGNPVLSVKFNSQSLPNLYVAYLIIRNDGSREYHLSDFSLGGDTFQVEGIGADVSRVILIPFVGKKTTGFTSNESLHNVHFVVNRLSVKSPTATPIPVVMSNIVNPENYGLHEGDFIRAEGDYRVYVINAHGYRRHIANPSICLLYKHLGSRGCFDAVRVVSPAIRDLFSLSTYVTNGETGDGKIFNLTTDGISGASLQTTDFYLNNFSKNINEVFSANSKELQSY